MAAPLQTLHRARRLALRLLRARTRGVKVMVFDPSGALLLVRHSYGKRHHYLLPGGGIGRGETPLAAAAREIREETGLEVEGLGAVSIHESRAEGRRDTIHLFAGFAAGQPQPDGIEVVEAVFFRLDSLPDGLSPATERRIAEYRGERQPDGRW